MPTQDELDLGRMVYRGIQAEDAVFKSASDDIAQIVQSLGEGALTDIDRRRAMRDIDRVLDRAFGSTQSAAQRSDLTQTIYESMQRAADVPFQRAADRVQNVLRNDLYYRGLYGPIVTQQRARRAAMLDVNRRWVDPKGYRLSDRVWKQGRQVRTAIDDTLREGIRRGMSADRIARELRQYLDPSNAPTRYTRGGKIIQRRDGGTKRGYASGRARTLARTEITRVHGLATIEAAKVTPGNRGIRWRLSAGHTDQDVCNDLASRDGYNLGTGVYPTDQVPTYPQHPNDLCTLVPVMASRDDVLNDILREFGDPESASQGIRTSTAPAFRSAAEAESWAAANLKSQFNTASFAKANVGSMREVFDAIADFERVTGKRVPATIDFSATKVGKALAHYDRNTRTLRIKPSTTPAQMQSHRAYNAQFLAERGTPFSVYEDVYGLTTHEIGHAVDHAIGHSGSGMFRSQGTRWDMSKVSGYADTKLEEAWAESFLAIAIDSPQAIHVPQPVADAIRKILGRK